MVSSNPLEPNDDDQNDRYNPGNQDYLENMATGKSRADKNQDKQSIGDEEDSGGNWEENFSGTKSKSGKGISKDNFIAIAKRRGLPTAIISLVLGGGIGAGILFAPNLLFFQIQASFLNKFDSQNTSYSIRTNKIIANKILGDATQGQCEYVKIACRFSRPSNKLLLNLEKSGITALKADGTAITKTGVFQSDRPAFYEFEGNKIDAKDFSKRLTSDPKFRSAFHRAYNPRVVALTDSVFRSIAKRFGFDTKNPFGGENDPKNIKDGLNESSKGARAAIGEGGEEVGEALLTKLIKERTTKALDIISKSGKGGGAILAAGVVCTAADVPGAITAVSRAYQMSQLVNFSAAFLTTTGAMKASAPDLTSESVSVLGSKLTDTVDGKSAMDSFGMKYALDGDTSTTDTTYKAFAPGVLASAGLAGVATVTSGQSVKDSCAVALNPVTGGLVTGVLVASGGATFGTSIAVAGVNIVIGVALGEVISKTAPLIIDAVTPLVRPAFAGILSTVLGDLTRDIAGQDVGNALASGASHVMGQTASAGGNVPLSVNQAVAYKENTKAVQLAYAEEDRATLSPLDGSNKNTFVGSMVSNLIPYYSQLGSVTGTIRTVASIPLVSLSKIGTPAKADDTAASFTLCDDPAIKAANVAAGPFCNIEYGIPTEYLDMEPIDILNELIATGDVDEKTGNPKKTANTEGPSPTDYQGWLDLCTDGSTDQAANCVIDAAKDPVAARKVALYAVYTIDHRVQKTMDGQDDETKSTQSTAGGIVLPVPDDFSISSDYGYGGYGGGNASFHRGLDFVSSTNEVRAFRDGTVLSVGDSQGNNTVAIQHSDGLISWYLHMFPEDILVKAGDVVTAGQRIGTAGDAGQSYGTHLHFALNITALNDPTAYADYPIDPTGRFISPREYFIKNGFAGFQ